MWSDIKTAVWQIGGTVVCALGMLCDAQAVSLEFATLPFPPFAMEEGGETKGIFPDILQAMCKTLEVQCEVRLYPWRRALRMAETGQVHGMLVIQKLPEREQAFYVSDPIIRSSYSAFLNKNDPLIYKSPQDLEGYMIAAHGPSGTSLAADGIASSLSSARKVVEIDILTVLRKLSIGRYGSKGAGVVNTDVARYVMRMNNITNVRSAGEVKAFNYYIGFSKSRFNSTDVERFNMAFRRLLDNGTVATILAKYGLDASNTIPSRAGMSSGLMN